MQIGAVRRCNATRFESGEVAGVHRVDNQPVQRIASGHLDRVTRVNSKSAFNTWMPTVVFAFRPGGRSRFGAVEFDWIVGHCYGVAAIGT